MRRVTSILSIALTVLMTASAANAAELLVPTQYATIQEALDAAQEGDAVVVEPGTYMEELVVPAIGVELRSQSGDATDTILDGTNIPALTPTVLFDGDPAGERSLRGFTLTNGGPAVRIPLEAETGHYVVQNCRFTGNSNASSIQVGSLSTDILDNEFIDNTAVLLGGAILCNGQALIQNNRFINNHAVPPAGLPLTQGGAIHTIQSNNRVNMRIEIRSNYFEGNSCTDYGGAIQIVNNYNATIAQNTFRNNVAGVCAGAIYAVANDYFVDIRRNLFIGNDSFQGSAIAVHWGGGQRIQFNTIVGSVRGEAVRVQEADDVLLNRNIVAFNENGGILWAGGSTGDMTCNDSYGNVAADYAGRAQGADNFSEDPLFCDAPADNYRISESSICAPANNSCGVLIGMFIVDCGALPTEKATWGSLKSRFRGE